MVRSVVADENLASYFSHLSKQNTFSIGLILGQTCAGKDYVIHFAKTPQQDGASRLKSINDISEDWICDHARQATRMLPGGMYVLGIFLQSTEDVLNTSAAKIKSLLNKMQKHLTNSTFLFGNFNTNERLVLNVTNKQFLCKTIETNGSVKPADFKFIPTIKWTPVQCKYQMEQIYSINNQEKDFPLKQHMNIVLDNLNKKLQSSIFLFDGELKDLDESLDKKKVGRGGYKTVPQEDHVIATTILHHCNETDLLEMSENGSQIKIFGYVHSKLWLHPKNSYKVVAEAVREDIMRSLSTRFEMHWDSLTEEEHGEDVSSVHEPPRRVLISLPKSEIAISDYLFPGEGASDVKVSLEELLDFKLHGDEEVDDVEGQADLNEYYNEAVESEIDEPMTKSEDNRTLYLIGLGIALLVLVVSLVIHFLQNFN